jgi:hypothetical protein
MNDKTKLIIGMSVALAAIIVIILVFVLTGDTLHNEPISSTVSTTTTTVTEIAPIPNM